MKIPSSPSCFFYLYSILYVNLNFSGPYVQDSCLLLCCTILCCAFNWGAKEKDNSDSHCIYLGCVQYFTHSNKQCEKTCKQTLQHKQTRIPHTLGIIRNQAYTITVYRHQHDFSLKHLNIQAIYMTAKRRCCVQRHLLLQIETRHPTEGTM